MGCCELQNSLGMSYRGYNSKPTHGQFSERDSRDTGREESLDGMSPHTTRPDSLTFKDTVMKIRHIILASTCTAVLTLTGCASNPSSTQVGTGVGAVVGGVAGNALFGGTLGTVGGAAAGALVGHELGEDRDQRKGRR